MSTAFADIFRNRGVLITGHTGFKGSWLAIWLHLLGTRVSGYALEPPTAPSNFELSRVRELLGHHFIADIRDRVALVEAFEKANPEFVFHLAAQPLVRESYRQPVETFEVNILGTANLLEVIRQRCRPCVVVLVSSDKCYENREQVWGYRECDPIGGNDPYSASKGAAEVVIASFRRSFFDPKKLATHGVKIASARAGNVIGGGDWSADRIVPDIVRAIQAGLPVEVRNPNSVRPWQHVLEPLSGYLALAARMMATDDPELCSAWNFGPLPESEVSVRTLVERFFAEWGGGTWTSLAAGDQPHEAGILRLSIEKASARLGWKPVWDFRRAVKATVAWYQAAQAPQAPPIRKACLSDIEAFERSMEGKDD